jgi:hypothetical protein
MKKSSLVLCFALLITQLWASEYQFTAIRLLPGYSAKREHAVDATSWTIRGKTGLTIHFEAGLSEGRAADAGHREEYQWYREQYVNGHLVCLALVKPGTRSVRDLDMGRKLRGGNVVLVTFPLSGDSAHAANFVAKVANSEELADVLLMALTFDPSKEF